MIEFGLCMELRPSAIAGGGAGVFLSQDSNAIDPERLVALYPGNNTNIFMTSFCKGHLYWVMIATVLKHVMFGKEHQCCWSLTGYE